QLADALGLADAVLKAPKPSARRSRTRSSAAACLQRLATAWHERPGAQRLTFSHATEARDPEVPPARLGRGGTARKRWTLQHGRWGMPLTEPPRLIGVRGSSWNCPPLAVNEHDAACARDG